jgi:hypothetical protein
MRPGGISNSFSISSLVKFETAKMRAAPAQSPLGQLEVNDLQIPVCSRVRDRCSSMSCTVIT